MTVIQRSLFGSGTEVSLPSLSGLVTRTPLAAGAWVDLAPGWVGGADHLFDQLVGAVPWRAERRRMYDRMLNVPRLVAFFDRGEALPDPGLGLIRQALNDHYGDELGEFFATVGLCCYRDGRDSVAWHGDTIGRGRTVDTMVAIVSLGAPRRFLLRPRAGGRALRFHLGAGDLMVMGGSCQRTWEHSVPKSARCTGPRISLQFRPHDVR